MLTRIGFRNYTRLSCDYRQITFKKVQNISCTKWQRLGEQQVEVLNFAVNFRKINNEKHCECDWPGSYKTVNDGQLSVIRFDIAIISNIAAWTFYIFIIQIRLWYGSDNSDWDYYSRLAPLKQIDWPGPFIFSVVHK